MKKKNSIRLLVVDDHPAFRMGLIALIQSEPDLVVVGEAADGRDVVELYRQLQPDIVLMDLRLGPEFSGVEAIIALRKEFPACRVIVVTTYDTDEDIYRAIQSGAQSYLLKDMSKADVISTIRAVHAGEKPLPPNVARRLANRLKREELSPRELEVLQLIVKGRSNKEIAAALFISEDTVKSRLKSLFTKLDVQDRTEAAITAVRHGIVHLE
ncbi:MAG TPA: response regulator transcription factor [Verrucomicrobiae bacterium]|nr:response regulator transcription factor [Verrucomicrobiae bacterium]